MANGQLGASDGGWRRRRARAGSVETMTVATEQRAGSTHKKTAVVVVHGMGEQRPMETLWGLVTALWTADPDIHCAAPETVR